MATEKTYEVVCEGGGRILCDRCLVAAGPLQRMRGLLGRRSLGAGEGLLLRPAAAIHTAFMRFTIDAVFLDREGVVLQIAHDLQPWRTAARRGARAVLELPSGSARRHGFGAGAKLALVSPAEATGAVSQIGLPPRNESEAELAGFAGRQGR